MTRIPRWREVLTAAIGAPSPSARAAEALKGFWKPQDAPQAPTSPSRALVNPRGLPGRHGATQHHWRVIKGHRWWFAVGPGRISAFTTQQHAMAYADREARKS